MNNELKHTAVIAGGVALGLLTEAAAIHAIVTGRSLWEDWRRRRGEPARRAAWEQWKATEREKYVDEFMGWPPEHPVRELFEQAVDADTPEAYRRLGHAMYAESMRPEGMPPDMFDVTMPQELAEETAREFVAHVHDRQSAIAASVLRNIGGHLGQDI